MSRTNGTRWGWLVGDRVVAVGTTENAARTNAGGEFGFSGERSIRLSRHTYQAARDRLAQGEPGIALADLLEEAHRRANGGA